MNIFILMAGALSQTGLIALYRLKIKKKEAVIVAYTNVDAKLV